MILTVQMRQFVYSLEVILILDSGDVRQQNVRRHFISTLYE